MEHEHDCILCGQPIEIGEAWLRADKEGTEQVAHSGCVYAGDMTPDDRSRWMPADVRD